MATTHAVRKTSIDGYDDPDQVRLQFSQEASSQTFVEGDLVFRSAGLVTLCGADPAVILGIAQRDAANDLNNRDTPVENIKPDSFVTMTVKSGASDHVLVNTNLDTAYGIRRDSAGKWAVDVSDVVNTRVHILRPAPGAAIGDTNAPCVVQFRDTFLQPFI